MCLNLTSCITRYSPTFPDSAILTAANPTQDNMNSKCVENTMCILRNLSFRLQEIVDPNYDRDVKPIPVEEKTTKCVGGKKKRNFEEEFLNSVYPYNMPAPEDAKAQEALWSLDTLAKYLVIIKESTVRDTIEAAVGCLQNLTACYWRPSVTIRQVGFLLYVQGVYDKVAHFECE